ncbi:MAG: hypothetical protein KAR45_05035 [Desulfobacteraceae bacterium]|nr:hypothetical protein [Desulfobacteraceae bacterium]
MNAEINENLYFLNVQNKPGTKGCFLKNTLAPPYKKPRLPFGGKSSTVHRLLEPLKIAHSLLIQELVRVEENLPHQYYDLHEVYNVEKLCLPEESYYHIGQKYFAKQVGLPFLIEGFFLRAGDSFLRYTFDLTPFFPGDYEYPGYKTFDLPKTFFNTVKEAAGFYNEYATKLFDKGFIIMPVKFVDALAGSYPEKPLPDGAILLNI